MLTASEVKPIREKSASFIRIYFIPRASRPRASRPRVRPRASRRVHRRDLRRVLRRDLRRVHRQGPPPGTQNPPRIVLGGCTPAPDSIRRQIAVGGVEYAIQANGKVDQLRDIFPPPADTHETVSRMPVPG